MSDVSQGWTSFTAKSERYERLRHGLWTCVVPEGWTNPINRQICLDFRNKMSTQAAGRGLPLGELEPIQLSLQRGGRIGSRRTCRCARGISVVLSWHAGRTETSCLDS